MTRESPQAPDRRYCGQNANNVVARVFFGFPFSGPAIRSVTGWRDEHTSLAAIGFLSGGIAYSLKFSVGALDGSRRLAVV